jgi:hypothetical protein
MVHFERRKPAQSADRLREVDAMAESSLRRLTATRILIRVVFLIVLCSSTIEARTSGAESPPPNTLEDIYGDTGNTFQAAIGFVNFEGTQVNLAQQSYGLALDDMVFKWREFVLEPDVTDCDESGSCAVVELATSNVFQGQTILTISLLDAVRDPENDCDLDGAPDGVTDCNGNLIDDVVVKATSETEVDGEIVVLDNVGGNEFKGNLATTSLVDSPGVLFLAKDGVNNPTVTVTYLDNDVDPGPGTEACPNDVDPAKHGLVQTFTTVFLGPTCRVTVVDAEITDNGDGDEFADTEETVDMRICVINNCRTELHDCTGRLFSNSPSVDCILDSTIHMGDLPDTSDVVCIDDAFRWKVADVSRPSVDEVFEAEFGFTMACDEIDGLSVRQEFGVTLDLDIDTQGQPPRAWTEGFEGGDLNSSAFFAENLDAGLPGFDNIIGLINSEGWRCQYSDPDWVNSNSYGNEIGEDCFPGATLEGANAIYWQVDGFDTASPDGGRAKTGSYSLYYGIYLTDPPSEFTTPLAIVESVATTDPINLGAIAPELSWWQQVSLMDGRFLNIDESRSADRGVVQYKTVSLAGTDTSDWIRLEPFQNTYDTQGYDFFFNCMFDPVDDGTTEDDFFDPEDPNRRLGPSSTCHPEFAYSCIGDTDNPFQVGNICNATVQPAPDDSGDLGTGTWVQSRVDLTQLKGHRIKLRFLVTGIKASEETHEGQFGDVNPGEWDNGWWIDDVKIDETLSQPALIVIDDDVVRHCAGDPTVGCLTDADCAAADTTGPCEGDAPQCGPTCSFVTVQVATTPDVTGGALDELLTAPGQPIELNAAGTTGICLSGTLQFRFSIGGGTELRGWSENPVLVDAPGQDTDYLVEARCSTDTSCQGSVIVDVDVQCPTSGTLGVPFPETISAQTKTLFSWATPLDYDLFAGDLGAVSVYAGNLSSGAGNSFTAGATPASSGEGFFFVVREAGEFCNDTGLWTSGGPSESTLREPSLP